MLIRRPESVFVVRDDAGVAGAADVGHVAGDADIEARADASRLAVPPTATEAGAFRGDRRLPPMAVGAGRR